MYKFLGNLTAGVLGAALFSFLAGPFVRPSEASYIPVPSGSIFYFDRTTATGCPVGYAEYTAARGAYIVGLVNGGTKATLVGTALTNQEDRVHTHSVPALTISASGVLNLVTGATNASQIGFNGGTGHLIIKSGATNQQDNNESQAAGGAIDSNPIGAATHSHGAATGTGTSGNNSVTAAPYLQLLVCKKN